MRSLSTIETSPAPPPSPAPERRTLRRALITMGAIALVVAMVGGGWLYATTQVDTAGAAGTFLRSVPKMTVTSDPADGAVDVRRGGRLRFGEHPHALELALRRACARTSE